jgi:membrane protein DedA with SNARE-associated domain
VLRALAALLAGANRMGWRGFLVANAAGGIVWAALYGFGGYFLGREIHHIAAPVGLTLGGIAVAGILALVFVLRRHEADLTAQAEAVLPGPLRPTRRG